MQRETDPAVGRLASPVQKYVPIQGSPVNGVAPCGHGFDLVGALTSLTTAEGLEGIKGGAETKVQWEMRDLAKQLVNDIPLIDPNQAQAQEGEEAWVPCLNKIPGLRTIRAKGDVSAVGPDVYGFAVRIGKSVLIQLFHRKCLNQ